MVDTTPGALDELTAFLAVVEAGGYRRAAARAGVGASTLSKRVKALEQRLGVQLLRRDSRKVELTQAGQLLVADAGDLPRRAHEAFDRVRSFARRPRGRLDVVMPTYFASSGFHRRVVPRFLRRHPEVELRLRIVTDPLDELGERPDVLVAARPPHRRFPDTSLVGWRILHYGAALYASPSYLDAHGRPSHPGELVAHNCLSYPDREWVFRTAEGEPVVVSTEGTLTTNSNAVLWAATLEGLGVARSFPTFFEEALAEGEVEEVLPGWSAALAVYVFHPSERFVPERTRAFVDALRAHFETHPTPSRVRESR